MLADVFIRVLAIGNHDDPDDSACVPDDGQRSDGSFLAGLIAVIAEVDVRRIAQELLAMLGCECRSQRRHDVPDASAEHGNRIHIALNNDGIACLLDCPMGAIQTKKEFSLIK